MREGSQMCGCARGCGVWRVDVCGCSWMAHKGPTGVHPELMWVQAGCEYATTRVLGSGPGRGGPELMWVQAGC